MLICSKFVTTGKHRGNHPISFIKGCSNFKTSTIKDNESSKLHTDAVAHFKAIVKTLITNFGKANTDFFLMNINDTNYKIIFEMYIHAFVKKKNNSPIRDIIWLTELDKAKNIDVGETNSN